MTNRKIITSFAIAAAAISCVMAPAAFAAPSDEVSVKIDTRYLETDWGVEKIYGTLSNKAENACVVNASRGLTARRVARDCMSDLLFH